MSNLCPACRSPIDADNCPTCKQNGRRSADDPLSTSQPRPLISKRAELLAVRAAKASGTTVVLLAVRIGTLSKRATTLNLSSPQALRLLDDLTHLFQDPELQDAAGPLDHESRIAFNQLQHQV